jgi:uncharacterized protein (DUF58 family)
VIKRRRDARRDSHRDGGVTIKVMLKKFRQILQLFSLSDLRNAIVGILIIFGGLGLAFLTIYAHQTGQVRLAGFAAAASLVFVLLIIVFVIPPLAKNASAEASQMNLPFEFTTGGVVFIGLLIIVAFAAWNTGNNLLFLVLSFLTSAFVIGFFVGNFCLKKLDVKMRFPETIFAEEPTPILVSLHNRKRIFPTFSITSEVRGKDRKRSVIADDLENLLPKKWAEKFSRPPLKKLTLDYFVHVPRKNFIENKVRHIFNKRGRFIIKDFELSTKFPFGFFRHRRRLSAQRTEIIIFPKLLPLNSDIIDLPLETGKLISARRGIGQDLLTLRDYQPLDDLRHIDWKATARTRTLTVREFASEDEKRVTIVFDRRIIKNKKQKQKSLRQKIEDEKEGKKLTKEEKRFENAVSRSASLISHFADERAEIRLVIENTESDFGIGKEHFNECLRKLALIEPEFVESFSLDFLDENFREVFEARTDSHLFFITAMNEKDIPSATLHQAKIISY